MQNASQFVQVAWFTLLSYICKNVFVWGKVELSLKSCNICFFEALAETGPGIYVNPESPLLDAFQPK